MGLDLMEMVLLNASISWRNRGTLAAVLVESCIDGIFPASDRRRIIPNGEIPKSQSHAVCEKVADATETVVVVGVICYRKIRN